MSTRCTCGVAEHNARIRGTPNTPARHERTCPESGRIELWDAINLFAESLVGGPRRELAVVEVEKAVDRLVRAEVQKVVERLAPPIPVVRGGGVTEAQLEKLGQLVERVDNFVHAGKLPISDKVRVAALTEALPELHSDLKALYIEIAGEDPWADGV